MTTPAFAPAPIIATPESLSGDQRSRAEEYIKRSGLPGLFIGALVGEPLWNIRPLLLDQGVVKLLRFTDPQLVLDAQCFEQCSQAFTRVRQAAALAGEIEGGVSASQLWQRRHFYQRTLGELETLDEDTLGRRPEELAFTLLRLAVRAKGAGLVHGHLSLQNIALVNGSPVILDYGFRHCSPELIASTPDAAPELARGERAGFSADVFGLARILQLLLPDTLSEEQKELVAAMQDPDPLRRPSIDAVAEALFPQAAGGIAPRGLDGAERLKLGKVLGTGLEVLTAQPSLSERSQADSKPPEARTAQEAMEWLKGTTVITGDVAEKIRESLAGEPQPEEMKTAQSPSPARERQPGRTAAGEAARGAVRKRHRAGKRKEEAARSQSSWGLLLIVLAVILALVVLRRGLSKDEPAPPRPSLSYAQAWASNMPSRMKEVAAAAAIDGDQKAELVIVQDALNGGNPPKVRGEILRVAFDVRWEHELQKQDREAALRLALAELLGGAVHGIPPLDAVHPAVLLASLGAMGVNADAPALRKIPLERLTTLPDPLGKAFAALHAMGVQTIGDARARSFAKILLGDASVPVLQRFLGAEENARSLCGKLELLTQLPPPGVPPERVLEAIDAAPHGAALEELMNWFAAGSLAKWGDVAAGDKLALVCGKLPDAKFRPENLADLLRFPVLEVRREAARRMLQEIYPPEMQLTMQVLAAQTERLTRDQTIALLATLRMDKKSQYPLFDKWFGKRPEPSAATVIELLGARRFIQPDDPFSVRAVEYLKNRQWNAPLKELKKLVVHQEALVRALAYAKLDAHDKEQALILQLGANREPLENLRNQIRMKLEEAGGNFGPPPVDEPPAPEEEDSIPLFEQAR